MPIRSLLLFWNSPRVHRYFERLAGAIPEVEIRTRRVGVTPGGEPAPTEEQLQEIISYGMLRKKARPHYGPARLAFFRALYTAAARLHYADALRAMQAMRPDAVGVWGGNALDVRAVRVAARELELPCIHFENGFLPATTQMDLKGVNAEGSLPRNPEFYRGYASSGGDLLPERLVPRRPKRGRMVHSPVDLPERYLFIPFQVALDSQLLLHSPWIRGMEALFDTVVAARALVTERPHADSAAVVAPLALSVTAAPLPALVFKEHPSCTSRYPQLHRRVTELPDVLFANGNSTEELIRGALGVITLNSSVGVEALLLGGPVLALGNAVFEVEGVSSSARSVEAVAKWMATVCAGAPPPAPLREPFLHYLAQEYLLPEAHQAPGDAHMAAVRRKLSQMGG